VLQLRPEIGYKRDSGLKRSLLVIYCAHSTAATQATKKPAMCDVRSGGLD
jgi:hypothetical protein